jgi:tRNA threonylcarbamoyladenosine biosynthesis protein TsaB
MRILALDTTTAAGSLAVLSADAAGVAAAGVVGTSSTEAYSSRLFRQLEFLLAELKLTTADFDLFAAAAGPGSFTGLRVGLTAVKGWAEVHGRPVVAVSALEAMAHAADAAQGAAGVPSRRVIVPVADARRGQVFAGIYEPGAAGVRRIAEDVVMDPPELWSYLREHVRDREFGFAATAAAFGATLLASSPYARQRVAMVPALLAPAVGAVGWAKAQRGETCDALTLDAHYVRRSDAEVHFKG